MNHKAVILGCNYYIGLSALRCLGTKGIHTVAVDYSTRDNYAARSKYCAERLIGPRYNDHPEEFIRFLIDYAKKQDVPPVLIPCHDNYVEMIDRYYQELSQHFLISQSETGITTQLMEKDSLYRIAEAHDVLIPETVHADEEHFKEKIDETVKFPCIVKPVDSPAFTAKFRKKIFMVNNHQELAEALEKAKAAEIQVFVQRIIPGFDDHMYTFDAYLNRDAKVTHWSTYQKYRQFPINFGASVYTRQKYVPELYDIGAKFLEAVGYKGVAEIEFKKDAETGKYYLIEINVRLTNFNTLLNKLGMNIPYIMYQELTGQTIQPMAIEEERNMVFRYGYEDMLAIRDYIKTGQLTIGQVMKSLSMEKAPAIWDWDDPMPGIVFSRLIAGKILNKLTGRK